MIQGDDAIERLRRTAAVLSTGDVRESLCAVQASIDVLDGASSVTSWMRSQLRGGATVTSRLTRAGDTLHRLPAVVDAVRAGSIRLEHVDVFACGLKHIDDLASAFLESGLPSDKGVRPHLSVRVDAETLDGQAGEAATLDGFGPIGPQLLALLACTADVTPVLTRQGFAKSSIILDVGRTQRLAHGPSEARRAPGRQPSSDGVAGAASEASRAPHHVVWWSRGGPIDLDNLIGGAPAAITWCTASSSPSPHPAERSSPSRTEPAAGSAPITGDEYASSLPD